MEKLLNRYSEFKYEAGTDEVGRGCLAGPVVAAAVILPPDYYHPQLRDSKKLNENLRLELEDEIKAVALSYAIGSVSPQEIDEINILQASFLAMHRALAQLQPQPEFVLVDGNRFRPYRDVPHHCAIKGDNRFLSIATASILAKNYRDDFMRKLDATFPAYGWAKNVGYPTKAHRQAIRKEGVSPHHRRSFRLLPDTETLF